MLSDGVPTWALQSSLCLESVSLPSPIQ
jgi:hypothetical protein